jgi:hypothetical protein
MTVMPPVTPAFNDALGAAGSPGTGGIMSSATTDPTLTPSPPTLESPQSLPTLEQLYEWTTEPDQRVVIRDVDWAFYEQLVDSIPEGANIHVDFDGKDLEIMSLSPLHDGEKKLFGQFVEAVAQEISTTGRTGGMRKAP